MFCLSYRRIYCLAKAVLESVKYLQYGKLYFQSAGWYKNEENRRHCEKVSPEWRVKKKNVISPFVKHLNTNFTLFMLMFLQRQRFFTLFEGHCVWSPWQQTGPVPRSQRGRLHRCSCTTGCFCLWRCVGLWSEIHLLSAGSAHG